MMKLIFQGDGANSGCFVLTSVETAEVYIGVCPEDINTGCKTTSKKRVIMRSSVPYRKQTVQNRAAHS